MTDFAVPKQTTGNGTVLLLVDSADKSNYDVSVQAVLAAFEHLGIPYSLCDLAAGMPASNQLLQARCIIFGQDGVTAKLSAQTAQAISQAVAAGVGLVGMDGELNTYPGAILEVFGVQVKDFRVLCHKIQTVNVDHFITGTREHGEISELYQPLEIYTIDSLRYMEKENCLLQTPSHHPVLMTSVWGQGRAILFNISLRLWTKEFFGHASGLDDVFWKSVVWAAKKPFAIYPMPPFASALVDDCSGSYNHFRYVDTMNEFGWIPHLEIYLEDIDRVMHEETYADAAKMKELFDYGLAQFGVHGFTYDKLMWFDHAARMPLADEQLAENFRRYDAYLKKWQIKPSRYENTHFSELGKNALFYLKERGIEFTAPSLNLDTAWLDVPDRKPVFLAPGPYRHRGYYMGYLKEDSFFFILRSKLNTWERQSVAAPPEVDFLWDHTIFWDESAATDIEGAVRVGIKQIRRGIDARFFGHLVAHEQRIAVVPMGQWRQMLAGIHQGLAKYQLIYKPFEYICDYAKSHFDTAIESVGVDDETGMLRCTMKGKTRLTTALEVYVNQGNSVAYEYCDIPQFSGTTSVRYEPC